MPPGSLSQGLPLSPPPAPTSTPGHRAPGLVTWASGLSLHLAGQAHAVLFRDLRSEWGAWFSRAGSGTQALASFLRGAVIRIALHFWREAKHN